MRIPAEVALETGALADLLTMPAVEVVARRVGVVADEHASRLGGPITLPDLRRLVSTPLKRVFSGVDPKS